MEFCFHSVCGRAAVLTTSQIHCMCPSAHDVYSLLFTGRHRVVFLGDGRTYLFNVFHTVQELSGDGVELQEIQAIEGSLQQFSNHGELERMKSFPSDGFALILSTAQACHNQTISHSPSIEITLSAQTCHKTP